MGGLSTALSEITLVVFTTLAPAGVCACVIVSLLALWGVADERARARLQHMCAVPLFLSMVGLVMSSTHLGTPTNALYVIDGIGRSPLSNEVVACVVFMGSTGLYWLYSFALNPRLRLQKYWALSNALFGVACIAGISFAYSSPTILTWDTAFAPLTVWLEAIAGGPLLALLTMEMALVGPGMIVSVDRVVLAGFVAFVLSVVALAAQYLHVCTLESGVVEAVLLIPGYPFVLVVYAIAGVAAYWAATKRVFKEDQSNRLLWAAGASSVYLLALFAVRFYFYMMHLTYGVGF